MCVPYFSLGVCKMSTLFMIITLVSSSAWMLCFVVSNFYAFIGWDWILDIKKWDFVPFVAPYL